MKIKFRKHLEEDIPYRVKWLNNKVITKYLGTNPGEKTIVEKQKKWFENYKNDPNKKFYTICDNEMPIGFMGLSNINKTNKNAEIFIMIGEESYHSKGIGRIAMKALMYVGFEKLKLHKLNLGVFEENLPAVNLYKSLGFKIEGIMKEEAYFDGIFHNTLSMAIFNPNNI